MPQGQQLFFLCLTVKKKKSAKCKVCLCHCRPGKVCLTSAVAGGDQVANGGGLYFQVDSDDSFGDDDDASAKPRRGLVFYAFRLTHHYCRPPIDPSCG